MLARLLYAAVALCLLGTRPEHVSTHAAPSIEAAVPGEVPAMPRPAAAPGIAGAPDFAIPRIQR
jgi:hypothetical protein